jgi:hypothetical protein
MAPMTIPKNFKFKLLFLLPTNAITIVESVDVEMVVKTLLSDTIDSTSKSKELLIPSPKSQKFSSKEEEM